MPGAETYIDFSVRLWDSAMSRRIPINGSIEITARCNLHCLHCYINCPQDDYDATASELSTAELMNIIDQIADAGCLWLLITGGEPLLRRDFREIYKYAKSKGILITLFTNGTLIDEDMADFLAQYPPYCVEITLYGKSQKTYDSVTGVSGSHDRCYKAIELLQKRDIPLKLKSFIHKHNQHELNVIKEYVASLGIPFRFDPVVQPRIDGNRRAEHLRLSPREVLELDAMDDKRLQSFCNLYQRTKKNGAKYSEYVYACGAGKGTFHIDPTGRLTTCIMCPNPAYDLRKGTFWEGWSDFIPKVIFKKWTHDVKCNTCPIRSLCDQCPGFAQLENGNDELPVEYLCNIAHLRAEVVRRTVDSRQ